MRRVIRRSRAISTLTAALAVALGLACASAPSASPPPPPPDDAEIYRRAESERVSRLEREVEHLRADLSEAEQELVAAESGLRGSRSRADAISALAEARIQVERATKRAPWRAPLLKEAEEKLDEAERLVEAESFGSAIFFAARAGRIARNTLEEARMAESESGARHINGSRVNLRDGPSTQDAVLTVLLFGAPVFPERESDDWILLRTVDGSVGWVHGSLIR
jgi:Spy/CpxP family protein refolding chaperone